MCTLANPQNVSIFFYSYFSGGIINDDSILQKINSKLLTNIKLAKQLAVDNIFRRHWARILNAATLDVRHFTSLSVADGLIQFLKVNPGLLKCIGTKILLFIGDPRRG